MPFAINPVSATITAPIGIDDAGGDRLEINADGSINTNVTLISDALDIVDTLDTPLLDASTTNIPASSAAPVSVVASLAAKCKKIQLVDTTGSFIGLYSDPAGTPVLEAVFGPGADGVIEKEIAASTVLGLRNMEDATISIGNVIINFFG
jgi:hypothetical protein